MKVLFKTLAALLIFVGLSTVASAQAIPDSSRIGAAAEIGIPTADISSRYTMSVGASVRYDLYLAHKSYLTASVGFNEFLLADGATTTQTAILNYPVHPLQTMPIKLGYKYLMKHFYVQMEFGETILLNQTTQYATKSHAFTYAPQFGLIFNTKNHNFIDAGLRYEGVSSFYNDTEKYNFWALHFAYAFKW